MRTLVSRIEILVNNRSQTAKPKVFMNISS